MAIDLVEEGKDRQCSQNSPVTEPANNVRWLLLSLSRLEDRRSFGSSDPDRGLGHRYVQVENKRYSPRAGSPDLASGLPAYLASLLVLMIALVSPFKSPTHYVRK